MKSEKNCDYKQAKEQPYQRTNGHHSEQICHPALKGDGATDEAEIYREQTLEQCLASPHYCRETDLSEAGLLWRYSRNGPTSLST